MELVFLQPLAPWGSRKIIESSKKLCLTFRAGHERGHGLLCVFVCEDNVEIPEMMGKPRNTGRVTECLQARELGEDNVPRPDRDPI